MRFLMTFAGMLLTVAAPALESQQRGGVDQPSPLDRTVTLALERVPLKDALTELTRLTGVRIAYSRRVVPLDKPVSVQLDAVRVQAALDSLLHGTGVAPTVDRSGQILLVTESDPSHRRSRLQTGSIAGTVRSGATSTPLVSARVTVVGTRLSAETDPEGRYAITAVPAGSHRVRARMLGYAPADTTVAVREGEQSALDFQLRASAIELDPVVATGYAAVRKSDLTGAVATVTADEFATKGAPTVTLSSGLQGKAAGVQVNSNSGMPGAGLRVRVRGTGSITANSEPLYVVDGLPAAQGTSDSDPKNNPLMSIDVNDIESIDVLKDASATAIYGARGANGVVLITTRRGQAGRTRVTLESSAGSQEISKAIPVLNAQQFMQLSNEAFVNSGGNPANVPYGPAQIASAVTYDYPKMMLRRGLQASQAITLSGGEQRLRYLLSGSYAYQEGIEIGSDFKRYGLRLNLDGDVSTRFRWGANLSMTRVARNAARIENGELGNSANGIQAAMQFNPSAAPTDSTTGAWIKTSPSTEPVPNPVANALQETDLNTTSRLLGSVLGEFDVTPAVKVRSTFGGSFQFDGIHFFAPRTILDGGTGGSGWIFSRERRELTNESTVTYRGTLGPGSFDALGGFAVQRFYDENVQGNAADFPTDATGVFDLGSGSQLTPAGSGVGESAILSYLGRANYNIAGKYLFTVTGRRDGSSRFGASNKWAFFPSGAFAWRISDEPFMRSQSLFNDLKLRLSYGKVGNQAVESYQSLSRLDVAWYPFAGTEIPALAPGGDMPNPDLKWEQQTQFNAGVDAVLRGGRLTLSLDHYRSKTTDLLLFVPVPSTTGYNQQLRNVGSVQNRGLELSLSTVNVQKERFSWRSTLNIAGNRNKVVNMGQDNLIRLAGRTTFAFSPSATHVLKVGEPLASIYGFQVIGLWQAGDQCYLTDLSQCTPGEYKIVDQVTVDTNTVPDGIPDVRDGQITGDDRVILGHGDPDFYGGFNNTVRYGPFSVDMLMTFSVGNDIVNAGKAYGELAIMQANERATVLDRWTPTNTNTTIPRANSSRPRRMYSTLVEDGSYLKLQALTLGYQLPAGLIRGVESARLFLTGQNLFSITGYSGFDPDVNSMGGDARFGGIDIGAYPRSRVWNFGVSVTF
jgi:TonB-linked SusC/RagA family outer membrane protein